MDANVVRCFIAVHLPAEVRAELTSLEDRLKARRHPFVKWVDPGSLHLTLKFLGNAAADSIPRIVDAMSRAAGPHAPFRLRLAGTGAFPGWQHPQVVWVGVEGDLDRLTALQKDLEAAVSPLGFPAESRSFSAHLTLGRLRDRVNTDDRRRFAQFAQSVELRDQPLLRGRWHQADQEPADPGRSDLYGPGHGRTRSSPGGPWAKG